MSSQNDAATSGSGLTKTLTITSGKGGVGKTTLVANVALQLGREGNRVLILDGDLGMANVDLMFDKRATKTIYDVLTGNASMDEVLMEVDKNVFLIPSGSGVKELTRLAEVERRNLLDQVSQIPAMFDYLIVDTAPGIDDNVLYLNSAAQEINVVVTPDPSSLADSYALIKVMNKYYRETKFSIICNMVKDEAEGLAIYQRLSDVGAQFLNVSLDYKGSIPADPYLRRATKSQQLVLKSNPDCIASRSIIEVTNNLSAFSDIESFKGNVQFFWKQYFGVA